MNAYREENTKLKTRIHQYGKEVDKKDKFIQELSGQGGSQQALTQPKGRQVAETHLVLSLKKQVKELKEEVKGKEEEAKALKQSLKAGKMKEMEMELKLHEDECANLKQVIVELIRQQPVSISPNDVAAIEGKFNQQVSVLTNFKQENYELATALQKREDELAGWKESAVQLEKKVAKVEGTSRDNAKSKKAIAENRKEIEKLKEQISLLKVDNKEKEAATYKARIDDLTRKQAEMTEKIAQKDKMIQELEGKAAKLATPSKEAHQINEIKQLKSRIANCKGEINET